MMGGVMIIMNINHEVVKVILKKIYELESENLKTKKYTDEQMVDKIQKLIIEEVKKCY
ncbi:hypothetical protein ULO1_13270 [Carboxydocella sp. ULO1]|nr:hypothetical protein ULO1_13270 [Carboxydocella sp. ULO1]